MEMPRKYQKFIRFFANAQFWHSVLTFWIPFRTVNYTINHVLTLLKNTENYEIFASGIYLLVFECHKNVPNTF